MSMGLSIVYFKVSKVVFSIYVCISVPEGGFNIRKNSVEPDEMQITAGFHLGLHYLPK